MPEGVQTIVESTVDFVEKQVILPTIGPDGMGYLPLLVSMFLFIFICNLFEVIPTAHMPANARMANPLILALIVVGRVHRRRREAQRPEATSEDASFPPGVPKALYSW